MFSSKQRSGAELLPTSTEALAERVDMLASTVSSAAAALARTDGEITGLRQELGNGLARLEELAAEMRSRARASDVRELEKKVGALDFASARSSEPKRLDELASKIAVLAERVDTLAATVATTASSVAGRDGEVASLRRMLNQAAPTSSVDETLRLRMEDVATASASATLRLESLDERLSELAERVDAAERERVTLAASVAEATAARWLELERGLAGLADRLDTAEEKAASVAAEVTRATSLWPTALRSLEARVEELTGAHGRERGNPAQPAADTHVLAALQTLEHRMRTADAVAHEERELLLDRLDRLAGRLEGDLHPAQREAEVVPLRTEP